MDDKIEIPISKKKVVVLTLGSLLFIYFGFKIFLEAESFASSSRFIHFIRTILSTVKIEINAIDLSRIFGAITIFFFGATGVFGLIKLFEKNTGIKIDKYGIHDYSNASSVGLIEWKDIIGLGTTEVSSQSFIMIYVNNPEKYIEKCNNIIKKLFLKMNLKLYGTPFFITPVSLKYNFEDLEKLIQSEFEKQKKLRINNPRL